MKSKSSVVLIDEILSFIFFSTQIFLHFIGEMQITSSPVPQRCAYSPIDLKEF